MKKYIILLFTVVLVSSCLNQQKEIVSSKPIQTDILDLKLGEKMTETEIIDAVSSQIGTQLIPQNESYGEATVMRLLPISLSFQFGGYSWTYVDVFLDKNSEISRIDLTMSTESIEAAKLQFNNVKNSLTNKYGKGNDEDEAAYWTDNINLVAVYAEESSTITGIERSFCTLSYTNIEREEALEETAESEL